MTKEEKWFPLELGHWLEPFKNVFLQVLCSAFWHQVGHFKKVCNCLISHFPGVNMLRIIYPAQSFYLQQGDPLILNCTVWHQQELSQRVNVHWCKLVGKSPDCINIDKGLEKMPLRGIPGPEGYRSFSLLLQMPQVEPADSGNYQCKASINDPNQSAVGHYVVVNVSGKQGSHVFYSLPFELCS